MGKGRGVRRSVAEDTPEDRVVDGLQRGKRTASAKDLRKGRVGNIESATGTSFRARVGNFETQGSLDLRVRRRELRPLNRSFPHGFHLRELQSLACDAD